ncbi:MULTISPECIES: glycine zipper domain-containing protein [Crateriforma]|nr:MULTISPECIES: glycine zipper domain-containing protein [Crateriforma]
MVRTRFLIPTLLLVSLTVMVPARFVQAQTGKQRGATFGGLAGAIAGGIIGDHNDEAGAGAAIGGVVGAVAGGILGDAADKEQAARQQQYLYQQQQQQVARTVGAVSITDVINMTRSGLGDSVIINQIHSRGVQHQIQVSDIIAMHQQGVRESVISAMQQATVGSPAVVQPEPAPVVVQQPTVIHETHVLPAYPVRRYYGPHYYSPRPYHYHRPRGTSVRIGF